MKLNKLIVSMVFFATSLFAVAQEPVVDLAQIKPQEINSTVAYSTEDVFRGESVGENMGEVSVDTEFKLPADINMGLGAIYSQSDSELSDTETDLKAIFTKNIEDYLLALSYTWYSEDFNKQGGSAQEVGFSVSHNLGPVSLTLTQYLALEGSNDSYSELSALYSNDFKVLPVVIDFYSELGFLTETTEFTNFLVKISTDLPVVGDVVASPFVAYSYDLGGSITGLDEDQNLFFGGIEFKHKF